jgi:TRAP-type C4-dicarboxylate transport system permease small subunit
MMGKGPPLPRKEPQVDRHSISPGALMESAYQWWKRFQDQWISPLAAFLLLLPIILAVIEVIRRYIFGVSWEWQQDMVTYSIIAGSYLFFSTTQRQNAHLRVTLFVTFLIKKVPLLGHLMVLLAQACSVLYLGYFTVYGFKMTKNSYESGRLVYSQVMPFWPFFLILTAGMAFMLVSFLFQIYREIQALAGRKVLAEEVESGH